MDIYSKAEKALNHLEAVTIILKSGQSKKVKVTRLNASLGGSKLPLDSIEGIDQESQAKITIASQDINDIIL